MKMNDLISRQDAIDILQHIDISIIPYKKAREYADATISEIRNRLKKLPSAQPKPKWIPCSERLPEDEQLILVTYKTTDRIHICRFHADGSSRQWYSLNDMVRAYNNVVLAWMPLPEPYREEGD